MDKRPVMLQLVPLMLVLFIATLDQTIVATAIGGIGDALGDAGDASWIATAYLLTSAVTTLIFGKLGDLYGRKRVLQASLLLFLTGSLLAGVAPTMLALIAARAFQGIGGGGLSSLVQAIIGDIVPARQRPRYQAYIGIIATLAIIAGPVGGALLAEAWSWRAIFLVNLPIGAVALVAIATQLRLPVRRSERHVDYAGSALATIFTTMTLLLLVWGGARYPWRSLMIIGLAAGAVISLAAYLCVERTAAEPITPLRLFRNSVFNIASVQFFIATLVLFVAMLYVPAFTQSIYHLSALAAGALIIPLLVGLIVATGVSGSRIPKTGRYKIYPVIGAALASGGMGILGFMAGVMPLWMIAAALGVVGTGLGFLIQVALLAGQNSVKHADLGVATGALNFFKTMGGAFGAALFGAILAYEMAHGASAVSAYQTVFFWCLPFTLAVLALSAWVREPPLSDDMIAVAEGRLDVSEY